MTAADVVWVALICLWIGFAVGYVGCAWVSRGDGQPSGGGRR